MTDKGGNVGSFSCDDLLVFEGADLANCKWSSEGNSLYIYPSSISDSPISIGDKLKLRNNTLKALCTAEVHEC